MQNKPPVPAYAELDNLIQHLEDQIKSNSSNWPPPIDVIHPANVNMESSLEILKRLELRYQKMAVVRTAICNLLGEAPNKDAHAYRLAAVDIFVAKAIFILDARAKECRKSGVRYWVGGILLAVATIALDVSLVYPYISGQIRSPGQDIPWERIVLLVPLLGLVITLVINFWRFGRAHIDQAERLRDRGHALRQGRLYIHLNFGDVKLDEFERAFGWNGGSPNAFGIAGMDPKMAWDAATAAFFETIPKAFKSASQK